MEANILIGIMVVNPFCRINGSFEFLIMNAIFYKYMVIEKMKNVMWGTLLPD